jgi:uncharacterized protein YodC (DUF2158 family)
MTKAELVEQVLQGVLVLVGEYRGSHAEDAGYVDKKTGYKVEYIRATHLVECHWYDRVDRVLLTQAFPDSVTTVEQASATFTYQRGLRYAFYLEWFKRERGQLLARLAAWEPELIEETEEAGCAPSGALLPF